MANRKKPTALKVAEGNRGKRKINHQEPDPDYLDDFTPPKYLSETAKERWSKIVPALRQARLVTKVDIDQLAIGIQSLANWIDAQEHINIERAEKGTMALLGKSSEEKQQQPNPWLIVQSMSAKHWDRIARQFGMSPQARTAISLNPQTNLPGFDVPVETPKKTSPYFQH